MSRVRPHQIQPDGTDGAAVADGEYVVQVADGVVVGLVESAGGTTQELPLTTATNGVPELVWDGNDELVLTEVPL